ncbi:MAG: SLC13 family permease [Planctomycetes bacterium]|nr:SLC13 family permease [Planctomycetota bacterium]
MDEPTERCRPAILRFLSGVVLAWVVPFLPGVNALPVEARVVAGVAVLTAWSWLTASLPLPVASLLPALLLPATGVIPAGVVAPWYFHDILLLFLCGFVLAVGLERYGLHRRFALRALSLFGAEPRRVVLGFMVVAAGLSMFVSNTSTALLMLPVALAVLDRCEEKDRAHLTRPLLLGIAYACSIGGVATPIGTAPNSVFLGQVRDRFPEAPSLGFGTWFLGAFPLVVAFLGISWSVLVRVAHRVPARSGLSVDDVRTERSAAGGRTSEQNRVLFVFLLVASLWMTRSGADFGVVALPGWQTLLPNQIAGTISDSTVALLGVMLLFLLPGKARRTGALLDWEDCRDIPWGILILLGGGFALAKACEASGLSAAIGDSLAGLIGSTSPVLLVFLVALGVTFLTEITSNTATINVLLPLMFSACVAAEVHPFLLALPATFAVSCAFMLPVATPPNAILFSSGRLTVFDMARAGILLNLLTAILVTLFAFYWIAPIWGLNLNEFPSWASVTPAEVGPSW